MSESIVCNKVIKKTDNWYRITLTVDKWDLATEVIDIIKTKHGEYSVVEGRPDVGEQIEDKSRYVYSKISQAKKFALALCDSINNNKPRPEFLDYI